MTQWAGCPTHAIDVPFRMHHINQASAHMKQTGYTRDVPIPFLKAATSAARPDNLDREKVTGTPLSAAALHQHRQPVAAVPPLHATRDDHTIYHPELQTWKPSLLLQLPTVHTRTLSHLGASHCSHQTAEQAFTNQSLENNLRLLSQQPQYTLKAPFHIHTPASCHDTTLCTHWCLLKKCWCAPTQGHSPSSSSMCTLRQRSILCSTLS